MFTPALRQSLLVVASVILFACEPEPADPEAGRVRPGPAGERDGGGGDDSASPSPPVPRPASCVHIEWCRKPDQPDQGQVICITNDDDRCTAGERVAECARDARFVCGAGHATPIQYRPPIDGMTSG